MEKRTTNCNLYKETPEVYCGRGKGLFSDPLKCGENDNGYFGNPIVIGQKCLMCDEIHINGGSTLKCYELYLRERLKNNMIFKRKFLELKGKKLGCFCKPKPCHTDVMIDYLENNLKDLND